MSFLYLKRLIALIQLSCEVGSLWWRAYSNVKLFEQEEEQPSALLTLDMDADLCLTPEQREAKLRRVERIRERVIRRWDFFFATLIFKLMYIVYMKVSTNCLFYPSISVVRESASTHEQLPIRGEGKEAHQVPPDTARKQRLRSGT